MKKIFSDTPHVMLNLFQHLRACKTLKLSKRAENYANAIFLPVQGNNFKKILGFSLVELMISLIVISVVTAAFTPILTKKLKTSDQSIGTATATSITSSAVCNAVSKGCLECEDDKCIAADSENGYFLNESTGKSQACNSVITGCAKCNIDGSICNSSEDGYYMDGTTPKSCPSSCSKCSSSSSCSACNSGYYLNSSSCTACSVQNAACLTCSGSSTCTKCSDKYLLSGGKCVACPNHCKTCSSTSVCSTCDAGYFVSSDKNCWKYTCDSSICYLTNPKDSILSIYRYYVGSNYAALGINTCVAGSGSCPYGAFSPICYTTDVAPKFTAALCNGAPKKSYSGCLRPVCNWYAANIAAIKVKSTGWRLPLQTDPLNKIDFAQVSIADPFMQIGYSDYNLSYGFTIRNCYTSWDSRCYPWNVWTSEVIAAGRHVVWTGGYGYHRFPYSGEGPVNWEVSGIIFVK